MCACASIGKRLHSESTTYVRLRLAVNAGTSLHQLRISGLSSSVRIKESTNPLNCTPKNGELGLDSPVVERSTIKNTTWELVCVYHSYCYFDVCMYYIPYYSMGKRRVMYTYI